MKNEYWKGRIEAEIRFKKARSKTLEQEMDDLYAYHFKAIETEIGGFLHRYAEKEKISLSEAQARVNAFDVQSFEAKAKKYVEEKNFSSKANAELRLYNTKMRMKAHELLQYNLDLEMVALFEGERQLTERFLNETYLQEMKTQAGLLGRSIPDKERIAQLAQASINANFHGANWSDRIWQKQNELRRILQRDIEGMLFKGHHPTRLIPKLRKEFDVSRYEAHRLAVTEMARVSTEAQRVSFHEFGYEKYEFIAEPSACPICHKLDGVIFDVKDMEPGKNAAPMHPNCHCTVGAYFEKGAESLVKSVEKTPTKVYNQSMKSSGAVYGAWNDKNDEYGLEREKHAKMYYEQIRNRNRKLQIAQVAKNSHFSVSDVEKIFDHIFINEHDLEEGRKRFDPNYDMAESWRRLTEISGKNVQKHDIVMLHHELMELGLMAKGMSYDEAHNQTNKVYNYQMAWIEWATKKGDL